MPTVVLEPSETQVVRGTEAAASNTSPQTTAAADRIPLWQKTAYGFGAFTNNLLAGAIGAMSIILNLGLGMNPAAIGLIMGVARIGDAVSDPIMGYISDHTRSRWGRRRPYIVAGALASAIIFALLWQIHAGLSQTFYIVFFLVGTNLFYTAYTVFATPYIGLGYEMTADYAERTRLQGFANLMGQIPWLMLPWSYAFMQNKSWFNSPVDGARTLALIYGGAIAVLGVLPGIFGKEPFYKVACAANDRKAESNLTQGLLGHVREFFSGFGVTFRNRRFLQLAAATFLVFNGFMLIAGLGSYVILFYVFGGDQAQGAQYVGWTGTALSLCTFAAIGCVTWMATKIGKKRAFIVSTAIAILGYAVKWFCYVPGRPELLFIPLPLLAFGLGGLFTTVSAMVADVCDLDELQVGVRREASFGAIYWWMVKLGTGMALALGGHLLNVSGFMQQLGANQPPEALFLMRAFEVGLPILLYAVAIVVMLTYDLDAARVQAIRLELELRRGKTA